MSSSEYPLDSPNVIKIEEYKVKISNELTSLNTLQSLNQLNEMLLITKNTSCYIKKLSNSRINLSHKSNEMFKTIVNDLQQALNDFDKPLLLLLFDRMNNECLLDNDVSLIIGRMSGLCRLLILILTSMKDVVHLLEKVLLTIHLLCGKDDINGKNVNFFMVGNIYSSLIEILTIHMNNSLICERVFLIVSDLASYDKKQRYHLYNVGCCEVIMNTLDNHMNDDNVLEEGIRCCYYLFIDGNCSNIFMKDKTLLNILKDVLENGTSSERTILITADLCGVLITHSEYGHHLQTQEFFISLSKALEKSFSVATSISSRVVMSLLFVMSQMKYPLGSSETKDVSYNENFIEAIHSTIEIISSSLRSILLMDISHVDSSQVMTLGVFNLYQLTTYAHQTGRYIAYSSTSCRVLLDCLKFIHRNINTECFSLAEVDVYYETLFGVICNMINNSDHGNGIDQLKISLTFNNYGACNEIMTALQYIIQEPSQFNTSKIAICCVVTLLCSHECSTNQVEFLKSGLGKLLEEAFNDWSIEENITFYMLTCLANLCESSTVFIQYMTPTNEEANNLLRNLIIEFIDCNIYGVALKYLLLFDSADRTSSGISLRCLSAACKIVCNASTAAMVMSIDQNWTIPNKKCFNISSLDFQLLLRLFREYKDKKSIVVPLLVVFTNTFRYGEVGTLVEIEELLLQDHVACEIVGIVADNLEALCVDRGDEDDDKANVSDEIGEMDDSLVISGGHFVYNIILRMLIRVENGRDFSSSLTNKIFRYIVASIQLVRSDLYSTLFCIYLSNFMVDKICRGDVSSISKETLRLLFENVFELLAKYSFEKRFVQLSCFFISRISSAGDFVQLNAAVNLSNLKSILQAFRSHFSHPSVCIYVIYAIHAIFSPSVCSFGNHGAEACSLITKCISENVDQEMFFRLSSEVLCKLCERSSDNVKAFLESDGCVTTLTGMKRCWSSADSELMNNILELISSCVCPRLDSDPSVSTAVVKNYCLLGGCEAIVRSLKMDWGGVDGDVKSKLLNLVQYFTMESGQVADNGSREPAVIVTSTTIRGNVNRNITVFLNEQILSVVLEVMQQSSGYRNVILSGCQAIGTLAASARCREECYHMGLTSFIAHCLENALEMFSTESNGVVNNGSLADTDGYSYKYMKACCLATNKLSLLRENGTVFAQSKCCEVISMILGINVVPMTFSASTSASGFDQERLDRAAALASECLQIVINLIQAADMSSFSSSTKVDDSSSPMKIYFQDTFCQFEVVKFILVNILDEAEVLCGYPDLCSLSLEAMFCLVFDNPDIASAMDCSGTTNVAILESLLKSFKNLSKAAHEPLIMNWCRIVSTLLYSCPHESLEKNLLNELCTTGIDIMKSNKSSKVIIEWDCKILHQLSKMSDVSDEFNVVDFLVERGFNDIIMQCLRDFINVPEIAKNASDIATCLLLKQRKKLNDSLQEDDECSVRIQQLRTALASKDEALLITTCSAIKDLICTDLETQLTFGSRGICELICENVRSPPLSNISKTVVSSGPHKKWSSFAEASLLDVMSHLCGGGAPMNQYVERNGSNLETPLQRNRNETNIDNFVRFGAAEFVFNCLKENWHTAKVAESGMSTLHFLISHNAQENIIPGVSASRIAISILKRHLDNSSIISSTSKFIASLSSLPCNSTLFELCDICDVLTEALVSWKNNPECSLNVLLAVSSLIFTQESILADHFFHRNSLLSVLVDMLKLYSSTDVPLLISTTCITITNFCLLFDKECVDQFVSLKGVEEICNILRYLTIWVKNDSSKAEAIVYNIFDLVVTLCTDNAHVQERFGECGACLSVVTLTDVLRHDSKLAKIGSSACYCLSAKSSVNRRKVLGEAAVTFGMVSNILVSHANDMDVLESVLKASESICSELSKMEDEERLSVVETLIGTNIFNSIVDIFQRHYDSDMIVIYCSNILNNIIRPRSQENDSLEADYEKRCKDKLGDVATLFDAVVTSLYAHIGDTKVVLRICSLVIKISKNHVENTTKLLKQPNNFLGAVKRMYRSDCTFLDEVSVVLGKMMQTILKSGKDTAVEKAVLCNMSDSLLFVTQNSHNYADASTIAAARVWLDLICNIPKTESALRNVTKGGDIVTHIFSILKLHPLNKKLITASCNALLAFLVVEDNSDENAALLGDTIRSSMTILDRGPLLVSYVREFRGNFMIQLLVISVIGECCRKNSRSQQIFLESNTNDEFSNILLDLLSHFITSKDLSSIKTLLNALDRIVCNCRGWQLKMYSDLLSDNTFPIVNLCLNDSTTTEDPQKNAVLSELFAVLTSLITPPQINDQNRDEIVQKMLDLDVYRIFDECVVMRYCEERTHDNLTLILSSLQYLSNMLQMEPNDFGSFDIACLSLYLPKVFAANLQIFAESKASDDGHEIDNPSEHENLMISICQTCCTISNLLFEMESVFHGLLQENIFESIVKSFTVENSGLIEDATKVLIKILNMKDKVICVEEVTSLGKAIITALSRFAHNTDIVGTLCSCVVLVLNANFEPLSSSGTNVASSTHIDELSHCLLAETQAFEDVLLKCLQSQSDNIHVFCDLCTILAKVVDKSSPKHIKYQFGQGVMCPTFDRILEDILITGCMKENYQASLIKIFSVIHRWIMLSASFRSEVQLSNLCEKIVGIFCTYIERGRDDPEQKNDTVLQLLTVSGHVLQNLSATKGDNVSQHDSVIQRLFSTNNMCRFILKVLDEYADTPLLVIDVCQLVYNVCSTCSDDDMQAKEKCLNQLTDLSGCALLLDILEESHHIDTRLVISICGTLELLGLHDARNWNVIIKQDSKTLLNKMIELYGDNGDVMTSLIGLMTIMSSTQPVSRNVAQSVKPKENVNRANIKNAVMSTVGEIRSLFSKKSTRGDDSIENSTETDKQNEDNEISLEKVGNTDMSVGDDDKQLLCQLMDSLKNHNSNARFVSKFLTEVRSVISRKPLCIKVLVDNGIQSLILQCLGNHLLNDAVLNDIFSLLDALVYSSGFSHFMESVSTDDELFDHLQSICCRLDDSSKDDVKTLSVNERNMRRAVLAKIYRILRRAFPCKLKQSQQQNNMAVVVLTCLDKYSFVNETTSDCETTVNSVEHESVYIFNLESACYLFDLLNQDGHDFREFGEVEINVNHINDVLENSGILILCDFYNRHHDISSDVSIAFLSVLCCLVVTEEGRKQMERHMKVVVAAIDAHYANLDACSFGLFILSHMKSDAECIGDAGAGNCCMKCLKIVLDQNCVSSKIGGMVKNCLIALYAISQHKNVGVYLGQDKLFVDEGFQILIRCIQEQGLNEKVQGITPLCVGVIAEVVSRLNDNAQDATLTALQALNFEEALNSYLVRSSSKENGAVAFSEKEAFAILDTVTNKEGCENGFQLLVYKVMGRHHMVSTMMSSALRKEYDNGDAFNALTTGCRVMCALANRDAKNTEIVSSDTPPLIVDVLEWSLSHEGNQGGVGEVAVQAIFDIMSGNCDSISTFSNDKTCEILSRYLCGFDDVNMDVISKSAGYLITVEIVWSLCTDRSENRSSFSHTSIHLSLSQYWQKRLGHPDDESNLLNMRLERAVLSCIRYLCIDNPENSSSFSELKIAATIRSFTLSLCRQLVIDISLGCLSTLNFLIECLEVCDTLGFDMRDSLLECELCRKVLMAVKQQSGDGPISDDLITLQLLLSLVSSNNDFLLNFTTVNIHAPTITSVIENDGITILADYYDRRKDYFADVAVNFLSIHICLALSVRSQQHICVTPVCNMILECMELYHNNMNVCIYGTACLSILMQVPEKGNLIVENVGNKQGTSMVLHFMKNALPSAAATTGVSSAMLINQFALLRNSAAVLYAISQHKNVGVYLGQDKLFVDEGFQILIRCIQEQGLNEKVQGITPLCVGVIAEVVSRLNDNAQDATLTALQALNFEEALNSYLVRSSSKENGAVAFSEKEAFAILDTVTNKEGCENGFQLLVYKAMGRHHMVSTMMSSALRKEYDNGDAVNALTTGCRVMCALANRDAKNTEIVSSDTPPLIVDVLEWSLSHEGNQGGVGEVAVQAIFDIMSGNCDSISTFSNDKTCETLSKYLCGFDDVNMDVISKSAGYLITVEIVWALCTDRSENRSSFSHTSIHLSLSQYWQKRLGHPDDESNLLNMRLERAVLSCIRYLCIDNPENSSSFSELNIGESIFCIITSFVDAKGRSVDDVTVNVDEVDNLEDLIVDDAPLELDGGAVPITSSDEIISRADIFNVALYVLTAVSMMQDGSLCSDEPRIFIVFDIVRECEKVLEADASGDDKNTTDDSVKMLFNPQDIPSILLTCCDILSIICCNEENIKKMSSSGIAIVSLLQRMLQTDRIRTSPDIVAKVSSALTAIISVPNSVFISDVLSLNFIPLFLNTYKGILKDNDDSICSIIKFFAVVAAVDAASSKVPFLTSMDSLLNLIYENANLTIKNIVVIDACLSFVQNLVKLSPTFISKLSDEATFCNMLLDILKSHISNTTHSAQQSHSVCLKCCDLIRTFCMHDAKNIVRFTVGEILDITLDAIETSGDLECTVLSFAAITNTLTNKIPDNSNKLKYRELLGKAGICNALVEGLQMYYKSSMIIVEEICGALVGMCHDHTDNLLDLVDCGLVPSVSDVLTDSSVVVNISQHNIRIFCKLIRDIFDALIKLEKNVEKGGQALGNISPFSSDQSDKEDNENYEEKKLCDALLFHLEQAIEMYLSHAVNFDESFNSFMCVKSVLQYCDLKKNDELLKAFEMNEKTIPIIINTLNISCESVNGDLLKKMKLFHSHVCWTIAYLTRNSSFLLVGSDLTSPCAKLKPIHESIINSLHRDAGANDIFRLLLMYCDRDDFFEEGNIGHAKAVCTAVWGLAHDADIAHVSELGRAGACVLLKKSFSSFISNPYLMTVASSSLAQLIRSESNFELLKSADIGQHLANVFRSHFAVSHISLPLSIAVHKFAAEDVKMRSQLGQWGVCDIIVKIIKGMKESDLRQKEVVERLFGALYYLAKGSSNNALIIGEFGGVELVISSLNRVFNFSSESNVAVDESSLGCYSSNDIDAVVRMHCELLELLLENCEGNEKLLNDSAVACDCMTKLMKTNEHNHHVVSDVSRILYKFVSIDKSIRSALQSSDLQDCLGKYYWTLANKVTDSNYKECNMLSIYSLMGCLVNHTHSAPVVKFPFEVSTLESSEAAIEELTSKNVSAVSKESVSVVKIMIQHKEDIDMCSDLLSFLLYILETAFGSQCDYGVVEVFFDMKLCDFLISELEHNVTNERFVQSAILFLNYICNEKSVATLKHIGGVENLFSTLLCCLQGYAYNLCVGSSSVDVINSTFRLLNCLAFHMPNRSLLVSSTYKNNKQVVTMSYIINSIIYDALDENNFETVSYACRLIITLCTFDENWNNEIVNEAIELIKITQNLISESGVSRQLVNCVRNFPANSGDKKHLCMIMYACGVLCGDGVMSHEKFLRDFADLSLDRQLIQHLDSKDHTIQLSCCICFALSRLAVEEQVVKRMGDLGICFSLTQILKHNIAQDNITSILLVLNVIKKMTALDENCQKFSESRTMELLILTLQNYGDKNFSLSRQGGGDNGIKNVTMGRVALMCTDLINVLSENTSSDILEDVGKNGVADQIMYTMKYFLTLNADVVLTCCKCVWSLTKNHDANKVRFCNVGICNPLVQILKRYRDDRPILFAAVGATGCLASQMSAVRQLVPAGLCELSIDLLQEYIDDIDVVIEILRVISSVSSGDMEACHLLVSHGISAKLMDCMQYSKNSSSQTRIDVKYRHDSSIITLFCRIVASLSSTLPNAQYLTHLGAFGVIHQAAAFFPENETVAVAICSALKQISNRNSIFCVQFIQEKAYDDVMMLLETYTRNVIVVESLFYTLHNVMQEIKVSFAASSEVVDDKRNNEVYDVSDLDAPLFNGASVSSTLFQSEKTLRDLLPTGDCSNIISDRKLFTELFVSAFRIHSSNPATTSSGCAVILALLLNEYNFSSDFSDVYSKSKFHIHDKDASPKDTNPETNIPEMQFLKLLTHYGVVEVVAAAFGHHVTNFEVLPILLQTITICCCAESKVQLLFGHQDLSLAINNLFNRYREADTSCKTSNVTKEAASLPPPIPTTCYKDLCLAISALTKSNFENALAMGSSGICEIIASIQSEFIENSEISAIACDAICHLSFKCEDNMKKFEKLGVPNTTCTILKEHVRVPLVVKVCSDLIFLYSVVPRIFKSMTKHGQLCETLLKGFVTHTSSDTDVLVSILWAMSQFTRDADSAKVFDNNKTSLVLLDCLIQNKSIKKLVLPIVNNIMELSKLPNAVDIFSGSVSSCSSLLDILCEYSDEPNIVAGVSMTLINLVKTEQQRAKLISVFTTFNEMSSVSPPKAICMCIESQMDKNKSSRDEFIQLLSLLVQLVLSLCQGSIKSCEAFGKVGACDILMKLLTNAVVGESEDLLVKILKCTEVLGISKNNTLILGQEVHCRSMLKILKNYVYKKKLCIALCSAASLICMNNVGNKDIYGENGFCSLACEVLRVHTDDANVIAAACAALWSFGSGHEKNTLLLSQAISICDLLTEILKLHFDNALVCGAVCGLLAAILHINKTHFPAIKSSKMQDICLASFSTYSTNPSVIAPSMTLLRMIFQYESDVSVKLCPFINHYKECCGLVKMIQNHKTNVVILEEICLAISILCGDESSPCIRIFGEKLNIFQLLTEVISVAIIDKNRKLASLALTDIALLCSGNSYNQKKFGETDACQVVVYVVQKLSAISDSSSRIEASHKSFKAEKLSDVSTQSPGQQENLKSVLDLERSVLLTISVLARHSSSKSSENTSNIDKMMLEGACELILSIAMNRLDYIRIVEMSCRAIFSLSGNDSCCHRFNRNGVCGLIASSLQKYPESVQLSHYICGVVANVAVIDDGNALLVIEKVPQLLVETLRVNGTQSKDVATYAFVALNNLVGNKARLRTQLGEYGCCRAIIDAVKMFQSDSSVLKTAVSLIANLVLDNESNATSFIAEGAFHVIIDGTFQHLDDSALCHSCFVFILSTSSFSESSILELLKANVCLLISKTLKSHPDNGSIVDICCVATQYLLSGQQDMNDRVGTEIIDQNIPENLLVALKRNANDLLTVQAGLKLLLAMMKTSYSVVDKMVACGVLKYIWESLAFNPLPNTVASPVCEMISLISHNDSNKILLKKHNLCLRMTNILELFLIDDKIIVQACVAMQNVMLSCPENVTDLVKNNVCIHLIKALNKHQYVQDVGKEILKVMTYLVKNDVQAQKDFVGEVLCLALSGYYLRNHQDLECSILCCSMIKYIARSSSERDVLGKSGVCGTISINMDIFNDSKEGCLEYIAALHAMSVENKDNVEIFGLKGSCECIVQIMTSHQDDVDFVMICLKSVIVLSSNKINAHKLTDSGCCDVMIEIFKKFMSEVKVSRLLLTSIRCLSSICENSRLSFIKLDVFIPVIDFIKKCIEQIPLVELSYGVLLTLLDHSQSKANRSSGISFKKQDDNDEDTNDEAKLIKQNIDFFCEAGGVEIVNEVLHMHKKVGGVVVRVCAIIISLTSTTTSSGETSVLSSANEIQTRLGKGNLCQNLVLALSHHLQEKLVTASICKTIQVLCHNSTNRYTLGSVGSCLVVAKLLQFAIKFEDLKLVVEVLKTIRSLTEGSCYNQDLFGKLGACEFISGLVGSENGQDVDIHALWCIKFLCRSGDDISTCNEANSLSFGQDQVFEGIFEALQEHKSVEKILFAGLTTFLSLCCVDSNTSTLISLNGCEIIANIVNDNMHNVEICLIGIDLLTLIAQSSSGEYAKYLLSVDSFDVIGSILRRHESDSNILIRSCKYVVSFYDICSWNIFKGHFLDAALCPSLINSWRKNIQNNNLLQHIVEVIEKVCQNDKEVKIDFASSGALELIIRTVKLQQSTTRCLRISNQAVKALTSGCNENLERFRLLISGTDLEGSLAVEDILAPSSQDDALWISAVDME